MRLILSLILLAGLICTNGTLKALPKAKVKAKYIVFTEWGKGERQFGAKIGSDIFGTSAPEDFDIDPQEKTLWIADTVNHRLSCYTTEGKFLFHSGLGKFKSGPQYVAAGEKYVFAFDSREERKGNKTIDIPYLLRFDKSGKFQKEFQVVERTPWIEHLGGSGFILFWMPGERFCFDGLVFDAEGHKLEDILSNAPYPYDPFLAARLGYGYEFQYLLNGKPCKPLSQEGSNGILVKKYDLKGNPLSQVTLSPPTPTKKGFKPSFGVIGIDKHGCLITEFTQEPLKGSRELETTTISIHDPKTGKVFGSVCLEKAGFPLYSSWLFGGTIMRVSRNGNVYISAPDTKHFKIIKVEFQH